MGLCSKLSTMWQKRGHYYSTYFKKDFVALRRLLAVKSWMTDKGDETRRLEYPLNAESIVFDLGAYKGDFAVAITEKFDCRVFLFEPMPSFHRECVARFKDNPKISCFNFGLSSRNGVFTLSQEENSSSIVKASESENGEKVVIREFASFCRELKVSQIDLLKINIEGSEFEVLENLIENKMIGMIRFIQVQFHDFVQNAHMKRNRIRSKLRKTHKEMWNYFFIWESWERKR